MAIIDTLAFSAKYAAGAFVIYWLSIFSYRFFLHPLRNYPGPFFAKITDAYGGYYALARRLHLVTQRNHKKYGPVVRPAPNRLVFNSAKALHDIYESDRIAKSQVYLVTLAFTGTTNVFSTIDKNVHRGKRKLIGQAITDRAMRQFEPTMSAQIDIFLKQILASAQVSETVNMTQRAKRLGMDIVGLLAFGYPLKMQTETTYRALHAGLDSGNAHTNALMQFPRLQSRLVAYPLHVLTWTTLKRTLGQIQHIIQTRLAQDKNAQVDLYSLVIDSLENNEDNLRLSDLWSEALFFLPAGGDTTAAAISSIFFYLSRNADVYGKLAEEIRTTFSSDSDIHGGPKLSSCRYLRACIDEALRMSPPVNGTLWRQLVADDDSSQPLVVDGHVVPPGTHIGVNIYTLHHNEDYFPDPYKYKPERWLDSDEYQLRNMKAAFASFSAGSRSCAGKPMAYLELSLVVAKSLWYFDFETAPGDAGLVGAGRPGDTNGRDRLGEFQLYDIFASAHDGPNLVFHPRDASSELAAK